MFPDATMPGVNAIVPDLKWLSSRADDIVGLVITHGHEDHVGGVANFVAATGAPVFGSPLTMAMADHKLKEARLTRTSSTHVLADGERRHIGPFDVEVIPITHSVPQSLCVIIHSPQGVLVHTGDFKIDKNPVDGRLTDLKRLAELSANPGVRLLMSDSTNADGPGRTPSESDIGETFRRLFPTYQGRRLIVSCFASHLHRVQQIVDVARAQGRFIFPLGRSMETNIRIATKLGILDIPEGSLRPISSVNDFEKGKVCVVCTGSQGEFRAVLSQLADGSHSALHIKPKDVVMLSSHPIPGNERSVFGVVNRLCRLGAEVVHDGHEHVHTSGHARREDLKELIQTVRPQWFVPIEGEFHMLTRHASLAVEAGVDKAKTLIVTDGARLSLNDKTVSVAGEIDVPPVMFDGSRNEVSDALLNQRRQLSTGGMVHVTVALNRKGDLIGSPDITTRGWIDTKNDAALIKELQARVVATVASTGKAGDGKAGGGKDSDDRAAGDRAAGDRAAGGAGRQKKRQKGKQDSKQNNRQNSKQNKKHTRSPLDAAGLKRQIHRTTGRFVGERTRLNAAIEVSVIVAD